MSLLDRINGDIKQAILAKEKEKLAALRSVKAALLLEMTKEGADGSVSEEIGLKVVQKLYKQRNDAAKIYNEQDRIDLASVEEKEAEIIAQYLPEMMSEGAVVDVVADDLTDLLDLFLGLRRRRGRVGFGAGRAFGRLLGRHVLLEGLHDNLRFLR